MLWYSKNNIIYYFKGENGDYRMTTEKMKGLLAAGNEKITIEHKSCITVE